MKSVLLIGLGTFGGQIARQFNQLGHQVMAVDREEARVNEILPFVTNAQIGDSTDVDFLKSLGIRDYDVCIVAIREDFQSSLETTSLLAELGAKKVVARATSDIHEKFLLSNGADEVLYPEKQLAAWAAIKYSADHILDYIRLDDTYSIFEVSVPEHWIGKSIGQIDIRKKYRINIVAVKENEELTLAVSPDILLTEEKTLLVVGDFKALRKCFHV